MSGDTAALEQARALKRDYFAIVNSDPARAAGLATSLAQLAARCGEAEAQALADWTGGVSLTAVGQMEEAIVRLDRAAAAFERIGQPAAAAETQVAKVMALAMLGRQDEATALAAQARATFLGCGDERSAGKIELNLGSMLLRADRYAEAVPMYRQAAVRFARIGDSEHSIMADIGLADALTSQHVLDEAMRIYERARARAQARRLPVLTALVHGSVGLLELHRGRLDAALRALEASRRGFEELGLTQRQAVAERNLADAYLEVNLLPEAISLYDRALATFAALDMPIERAWAHLQRGRALALSGQAAAARAALAQAAALFGEQDNPVCAALVELWDAELALRSGEAARALERAELASPVLAGAGLTGWRLLAETIAALAQAAGGQSDAARRRLEAARAAADAQQLNSSATACRSALGRLAESSGEAEAAIGHYEEAATLFEAQRVALPGDEFRSAFAADRGAPFEALVRLAARRAGADGADVLARMERARARSLLDELGARPSAAPGGAAGQRLRERLNFVHHQLQRALEDEVDPAPLQAQARALEAQLLEEARRTRLHDSDAAPAATGRFDPAALQRALADDEALVEYFLTDEALLAVVATRAGVRLVRGAPRAAVERAVEGLRFQVDALRHGAALLRRHAGTLARRAQAHLGEAHRLLIAPLGLDPALRRLIVVPHGVLHYVPFAALGDGQPLLARHELVLAPSAALWLAVQGRPAPRWQRALVVGAAAAQLPHITREVREVAACFERADALFEKQATSAAVRRLAGEVDVLHLACHGQFRADSPYFSALHLADGPLTVRDAQELPLRASLVTLSACETGVSRVAPGEELIGLTRGFLRAGVPAVLASLWAVDDEATASLMVDFYRGLQAGLGPAAALRAAQLGRAAREHPYYWAGFVTSGRG